MKKFRILPLAAWVTVIGLLSCNGGSEKKSETPAEEVKKPLIKGEAVSYKSDTLTLNGYVAYNENDSSKKPVVIVVPEWWGLNEYAKRRARMLAELGYVAMAVDFYGNGAQADNPELAGKLATPFYKDPSLAKQRFDAALTWVKNFSQADTNSIAAIGYCFGGAQVINMAKLGENLKGVVSFHGNLAVIPPVKDQTRAKILVCHGAADPFVPETEVTTFKKQMDSVGASYVFKAYPGATHAFTNPDATENGKKFNLPIAYQAAADSTSWEDMKSFLKEVLGK